MDVNKGAVISLDRKANTRFKIVSANICIYRILTVFSLKRWLYVLDLRRADSCPLCYVPVMCMYIPLCPYAECSNSYISDQSVLLRADILSMRTFLYVTLMNTRTLYLVDSNLCICEKVPL